jgi:crossover junction endodeoxyribonuclease RusA
MNEVSILLPYPPSVNHYKKVGHLNTTKKGKVYQLRFNSPETLQYFYRVWLKVRMEGLKSFQGATISVDVDVYPPDKRKRDLDGILKVLLDAMQKAGLYDDDYQIARLLVTRKHTIASGEIVVRIREII